MTSLLALLLLSFVPVQQGFPKLAPFAGVRFEGEVPEALVDGEWYRLESIDGVECSKIVAHCKATWPDKWSKRFSEDLVEVLAGMQHTPGDAVDLVLIDLDSGKRSTRKGVDMTAGNRLAARDYNQNGAVQRVEREHARKVPKDYAWLARPIRAGGDARLPFAKAAQDLDQLEWILEHQFSYRHMKGVDLAAACDAVRIGLAQEGDSVDLGSFAIQVAKVLALFGDGHTRLRGVEEFLPVGFAPCLFGDAEGGIVAFEADRGSLVDAEHPFLIALDGRPVDEWLAVAARLDADGSPQFVRRQALRNLRFVNYVRRELGLEEKPTLELQLTDARGKSVGRELRLQARKPLYGPWPRGETRMLDGNVGYLRIPSMSDEAPFLAGLEQSLESFADTRGLVIDVRGNGGGTRDALRVLLPHFLPKEAAPRVVNVAAYRLRKGQAPDAREGYLGNRSLYPASSRRFDDAQRAAIEAVARDFRPGWKLPERAFSDWHFFTIAPPGDGAAFAERPVVILQDAGCFSATDIFLAAFAGLPNVTLLGEPSGGGSGRSEGYTLSHSGLSLRASTMASFRADGRPYDGLGIVPDVLVKKRATDFLIGGTDTQLDAALRLMEEY